MSSKRLAVFLISLLVCGAALGYAAFMIASEYFSDRSYEQLRSEVAAETAAETTLPPEAAELPTEETTEPYISPIDFETLWQVNEDVVGWIRLPGTRIDYPILRHPESENYYLRRKLDKSQGYPGCIYMQTRNAGDFSDFNTVLYGHNMLNGSMFHDLVGYRRQEFFDSHRSITIFTPKAELHYQVFAAVVYTDDLIPLEYDFTATQGRQDFLDSLDCLQQWVNHFADDITVTPDDQIITLSTCIGDQPNHRYLVLAVLTNEEENIL